MGFHQKRKERGQYEFELQLLTSCCVTSDKLSVPQLNHPSTKDIIIIINKLPSFINCSLCTKLLNKYVT